MWSKCTKFIFLNCKISRLNYNLISFIIIMKRCKRIHAYVMEVLKQREQLAKEGSAYSINVRLGEECFDIRHYDTFSLPSGVYTSLRIEIGKAEGKNWWCVAFPSLCMPATSEKFTEVAADAGFSDQLTESIAKSDKIEIRFFFLDFLGNLENFLYNR